LAAQAEASERQVSVSMSPFLPAVGIGATYQRQSPNADPFFTDITKNNTLIASVNLTWQLFSGFQDQARLDQFRANLSQARLQKERAQIDLDGDVRRTLRAVEAQLAVAQVATENLTLAEQGLSLAEERFTAGAGSSLEVRDAQIKLVNAQVSGLQARVDVAVAREGLKRVVGKEVEEIQ
jgi:outer membrane protein TolC